jgi:hydrogenase maturation protein HypF
VNSALRIRVSGVVQGVGFRPFVWRLAHELELAGWVRNDASGVEISAEGAQSGLDRLLERIAREAPPLARVEAVRSWAERPSGTRGFSIARSAGGTPATAIGPDTAPCAECLAEMFDPRGRRWRHAFITCTNCGPRFTITQRLPYDRANTSMAPFALCADCEREYADPQDRRFHAEPVCCPACGPQLHLVDGEGRRRQEDPQGEALREALRLLRAGAILAVKGLGGYHLACDASNAQAVARLRERKMREEKPFAVMGAGLASLRRVASISEREEELLEAPERPVVLCEAAAPPSAPSIAQEVAPGLSTLGLMLPSTPLQYLLFHEAAGRPAGTDWLEREQGLLLVMTSANPGGEPIVIGDQEARGRLAGISDAWLAHDRSIVVRCDDSVRSARGFVRRARGFTPRAIGLARGGPPVLALGGWFKSTACLTRGREAFVGQHVGDLDNAASCAFLAETVAHLEAILETAPQAIACDLHPDFPSTRLAQAHAQERGLPLVQVQHHHAHIASVLAEHRAPGPAIGLAIDGVGLGADGEAWGGELLRVEGAKCERIARIAPLRLPGGDAAAREPWRMAASALHALGRGGEIEARFAREAGARTIREMLDRELRSPPSSSLGRVFDAAAGLLGTRSRVAYEGQAAMELESLAMRHAPGALGVGPWEIGPDGTLDLLPLLAALEGEGDPARGAALLHDTLALALAHWMARAARAHAIPVLAAAGGCMLNRRLAGGLREHLRRLGFALLEARELPPNDGGLSLGQAWVAMCSLES